MTSESFNLFTGCSTKVNAILIQTLITFSKSINDKNYQISKEFFKSLPEGNVSSNVFW